MAPKRSAAALASPASPSFLVKLQKRDLEALRIPASFYNQLLQENVELELRPSKRRYFVVVGAGVFGVGWKAFCKNNGIKEGDSIVFKASKDGTNVLTCKVYGPDGCLKQDAGDGAGSSRKRTRDSGIELISSDDEGDNSRDENLEAVVADGINAALAVPDQEREIVFTNCEIRLSIKKLGGGQIRTETPATKDAVPAKDVPAKDTVAASPARASRSAAAAKNKEAAVTPSGKKVSPATETSKPEAAVTRKVAAKASTAAKKASSGAKKASSARKTASATKAAVASAAKAAASKATTASPRRAAASPSKAASPASKKGATPKKVTTAEPVSPARSRLQSKLDAAAAAAAASPSKTPTKSADKTASGKKTKAKDSLLKVQKTVKTKRPGIKSPGKSSAKKPAPPPTPGEARALARARSFTSPNPHEVLVMKRSNLAPSFLLAVPRTFARESLPKDIQELEMLNDQDNAWNIRWLPGPKMTFSGGWVYFAQDNKLETGDACVLERLSDKRVKMHIFRASESDSADAAAATDKSAANEKQEKVVHAVEAVTTTKTTTTLVTATARMIRDADDDDDDDDYNPEDDEEEDEAGAGCRSTAAPANAAGAGPTPLEPADVPPVAMVAPAS